jgi:hypothetical protein
MTNTYNRLTDLEKHLTLLYEKLAAMERGLIMAYDAEAKISIEQRIREEVIPQVRKYEVEYWQLFAEQGNQFFIEEVDANIAITEVVNIVEQAQQNSVRKYPDELINLLAEIRDKLKEPEKTATAKLKAALPLLPPFLSYEFELDTPSILRQLFPTFSRLLKHTSKK